MWVNNVGVGAIGFFWDIPIEDHARVVDVNLKGLIFGAHAALKQFMVQGYGTLINTGSIDSETPLALQNTYASTKAAVLSLSRTLNEELKLVGTEEIKVGTIMPWGVDTPWWVHAANYTGHAPRMALLDDPKIVVDAIVEACLSPKEEQPVGWKAKGSDISHHLLPKMTERLSAKISKAESDKGMAYPETTGAIHEPVNDGLKIDGDCAQEWPPKTLIGPETSRLSDFLQVCQPSPGDPPAHWALRRSFSASPLKWCAGASELQTQVAVLSVVNTDRNR